MPESVQPGVEPLREALAGLRNTARDQMSAAWQIHVEQLQEQLAAGWPEQIGWIFEDRFRELQTQVEEQYVSAVSAQVALALTDARTKARREFSEKLNQSMRRLRVFESDAQWATALLDASEPFCERAVLFTISGENLRLEATRGLRKPDDVISVPLPDAPAFASAIQTRDTIVAMRTAGELSQPLAAVLGEAPDLRFHLFPIDTRERTAAILYADSDSRVESSALELLAGMAGTVLDSFSGAGPSARMVHIAAAERRGAGLSAWFELTREEQQLHLKAQRFARVQVAEMRLYHSGAVNEGRLRRDLYGALQPEIDRVREVFLREYIPATPTMVDYTHLEMIRTLANDDVELLGKDYPGPLA